MPILARVVMDFWFSTLCTHALSHTDAINFAVGRRAHSHGSEHDGHGSEHDGRLHQTIQMSEHCPHTRATLLFEVLLVNVGGH